MRIIVKKHDGCEYYSHVAVPTTRQERMFLKQFKYDLLDEFGNMDLTKANGYYVQALIMLGYCGRNDDFCPAIPNEIAIALGYYVNGKWRKWAKLRKRIAWLNPVGFHNWTLEEYSAHLDYLDSLMGDV